MANLIDSNIYLHVRSSRIMALRNQILPGTLVPKWIAQSLRFWRGEQRRRGSDGIFEL